MSSTFSILLPVTKIQYLKRTLISLSKQEFPRDGFEVICVNNGTDEDIHSIADDFMQLIDLRYLEVSRTPSLYPTEGWNHALGKANNEFVCLLGDDDELDTNFLQEIDRLICSAPMFDYYRARLRLIDENGAPLLYGWPLPNLEDSGELLYFRVAGGRPASIIENVFRKRAWENIGGFVRMSHAWGTDDATSLLMSLRGGVVSTNETFASWRRHYRQISSGLNWRRNLEITLKELLPFYYTFVHERLGCTKIDRSLILKGIDDLALRTKSALTPENPPKRRSLRIMLKRGMFWKKA